MTVTLANCSSFIENNLDGGVEVVDAARIINTAGQILVSMKAWRWLERGPTLLGVTADQPFVTLPSDFRSVVTLQSNEVLNIRVVAWEEWVQIARGADVEPALYAATIGQAVPDGGGPVTPQIAIYPTPTTTTANVFNLVYHAGWDEASAAEVTAGTKKLHIPVWIEALWFEVLQAVARGFEEDDNAVMSQRIELVKRGPLYEAALDRDSSLMREVGYLQEQRHRRVGNTLHLIAPGAGDPSA